MLIREVHFDTTDIPDEDSIGTIGFKSANESEILHHHRSMTAQGFTRHAVRIPVEPPGIHASEEATSNTGEVKSVKKKFVTFLGETVNYPRKERHTQRIADGITHPMTGTKTKKVKHPKDNKWGKFAYAHMVQQHLPDHVHLIVPSNQIDEYNSYVAEWERPEHADTDDDPSYLAIDNSTLYSECHLDTVLAKAYDEHSHAKTSKDPGKRDTTQDLLNSA
jgi:hypothetical protein